MKHKLIVLIFFTIGYSYTFAQSSLNSYLDAVKINNKTLQTAQKYSETVKANAKTGITPNNPEFEFGYFPGNKSEIGTKKVLGISQSVDFPTSYIYKNKLASKSEELADIEYQLTKQQTISKASAAWNTAVYLNKLSKNYSLRTADAQQMVNFYLKKQEKGDATQLEVNKAQLFLLSIQNKNRLNKSKIKRNNELLKQLNGGIPFEVADTIFNSTKISSWQSIKAELDSLLPENKRLKIENQMAHLNLKLNKSEWLPELNIGYEREQVLNDTYSGFKAGISLPLWQNKNSVKHAKSQIIYKQNQSKSLQIVLYNAYYSKYIEAEALQNNFEQFKTSLGTMNNMYLLSRSLELGQISAIEYFIELDYFYNILDDLLKLEFQYQMSLTELFDYKL